MRRLLVTLAASAMLIAACSSSGSSDAAAGPVTKESFCAGVETLMGESQMPEPTPGMSQEELDKINAQIDAALASVSGGVELGAVTAEQLDLLNSLAAMSKANYKDPTLLAGSSMPTAADLGLTDAQYALIFSPDGIDKIDAVGSSMQDYCKAE